MIKVLGQDKSVKKKSYACYWCGAWQRGLSHQVIAM